ncbi:hypothetical protein FAVG1_08732 [Fusarium avenaceum]|nr:hypothetical protein FAVG1_08732 [Fusarium avenaceum]
MIDFTLTSHQIGIRERAQKFSADVLRDAASVYNQHADQKSRFQATKPFYRSAVRDGLLKSFLPAPLGGSSEGFVDAVIAIEELFAVEPGVSLTLAATVLGLLPLILAGTPEQQGKYLEKFLSGEGEPLASLMHSEPGGTANWLQKGSPGLQTTAHPSGDGWIINGEKLWTSNSAGWDNKGADLACVVCRSITNESAEQDPETDPASSIVILLVTRETIAANNGDAYQVLGEPELMGHISTSGPHTRFADFYVPSENLLAPPTKGAGIIERAFGISAALVGAMATGIMRTAIKTALDFVKSDTRGGSKPIISHQSVADKLIDCKIRMETSRLITWKAAHGLDSQSLDWHVQLETALQAKIYTSDVAVDCVLDAMKAVGMTSYSKKTRFPRLLEDVMCYSLFDGGNVGIRRRQLQLIMSSDNYNV